MFPSVFEVGAKNLSTCGDLWLNPHELGYEHKEKNNIVWRDDKLIKRELSRNIWTTK
jgi:hypothetical protein